MSLQGTIKMTQTQIQVQLRTKAVNFQRIFLIQFRQLIAILQNLTNLECRRFYTTQLLCALKAFDLTVSADHFFYLVSDLSTDYIRELIEQELCPDSPQMAYALTQLIETR